MSTHWYMLTRSPALGLGPKARGLSLGVLSLRPGTQGSVDRAAKKKVPEAAPPSLRGPPCHRGGFPPCWVNFRLSNATNPP